MSFTGFSEDDIRKVKENETPSKKNSKENLQKPVKEINLKNGISKTNKERKYKQILLTKTEILAQDVIPDAACLNKVEMPLQNNNDNVEIKLQMKCDSEKVENVVDCILNNEQTTESNELKITEKRFIDLEEFQTRQKLIEEQNRKRKELLAKALADRTKQTQEEAQRLNSIHNEFKKLDALLSNDVKILRKQIEVASVEYTEAEKKYLRIEKEFLDAKLFLHQKLERKEMLTEHLCTIIEKNEERKAEKLMELLQKLNLQPSDDKEDEKSVEECVQISEVSSSNS